MRENPFYVSKSGVSSEHIGNRFPAIPRIAQSLKTRKMATRTSRKIEYRRDRGMINLGGLTWTKMTVAVCLAAAGTVMNLRMGATAIFTELSTSGKGLDMLKKCLAKNEKWYDGGK